LRKVRSEEKEKEKEKERESTKMAHFFTSNLFFAPFAGTAAAAPPAAAPPPSFGTSDISVFASSQIHHGIHDSDSLLISSSISVLIPKSNSAHTLPKLRESGAVSSLSLADLRDVLAIHRAPLNVGTGLGWCT
jgi:hypothetical protein